MASNEASSEELARTLRELITLEQQAAHAYKSKAAMSPDPLLQTLFSGLAERHLHWCAELQSRVQDVQSREEITLQINDMFL